VKTPIVVLLSLLSLSAFAEVDLDKGVAKYLECAACHGDQAQGNAELKAPALSHLQPVYIVRQLQNFATGVRTGEPGSPAWQMAQAVQGWTDIFDKRNVAVAIAKFNPRQQKQTLAGSAANGQKNYNNLCAGCHGKNAEGKNVLHAPALAGSQDWYLLAQIRHFQSGSRGSHNDDQLGAQMQAMSNLLDDWSLLDVIAYINSQPLN
jgi:cytochrome c553